MDRVTTDNASPRKRPSRLWYLVSAVVLLLSLAIFVMTLRSKASYLKNQITPMPRFIGPTSDEGVVITLNETGKHSIFYENKGTLEGKPFKTPRSQVWTTYQSPSMSCTITRVETGESVAIRLPGQLASEEKSRVSKDQVINYDFADMQGHSVWVFDVDKAGDYRIKLSYNNAVYFEPGSVQVPPELTKEQKQEMLSKDGLAYEESRREAFERNLLSNLDPIDVVFAVGPDPTRGSFFNLIGLKGAAGMLAFGFTFAALTSLVTLMLRGGHVTPRGKIEDIRRMGE